jgi:hypothetical protein
MLPFFAGLAFAFSLADHWTTYLCLRTKIAGWEVTEANPLAALLFERLGLVEGLLVDTLITFVVLTFLVRTDRIARPWKLAALGVLIGTTGWAVANNLQAVHQLGLSITGAAA